MDSDPRFSDDDLFANDPPPDVEALMSMSEEEYETQSKASVLRDILSNGKTSAGRFFTRDPEPQKWVFEGMMQKGVVGFTVAQGGTGKGFLTLYMAVKAALGHPFCGFRPPRPQTVLMLGWEDAEGILHQRFLDTVTQEYPHLTEREQELLSANLEIWPVVGEGYHLDHLVEVLAGTRHRDLIILDPLKLFLPPGMNLADDADAAALHQRLGHVLAAHDFETTLNLCHHVPKYLQVAGAQLSQAAAGGSATVIDLGRFSLNARKLDKTELKKLRLNPKESYIEVAIPKQNYAPELPDRVTFRRGIGGALIQEALPTQSAADVEILIEGLREMTLPIRQAAAQREFTDGLREDSERLTKKRFMAAVREAEKQGLIMVVPIEGKGNPKEIRWP